MLKNLAMVAIEIGKCHSRRVNDSNLKLTIILKAAVTEFLSLSLRNYKGKQNFYNNNLTHEKGKKKNSQTNKKFWKFIHVSALTLSSYILFTQPLRSGRI